MKVQKLIQRAKKSLYNPEEISLQVAKKAIDDADEAAFNKKVAEFTYMDFAYIRLKMYLKIELSAEDEMLYKDALKKIAAAPIISEGSEASSVYYVTKERGFSI